MKTMLKIVKRNDLLVFFILANLLSWTVGIPLALEAQRKGRAVVPYSMHYLYAFGPALAAIIVAGLGSGVEGIRELFGRVLKWRVNLNWWVVAFSPL